MLVESFSEIAEEFQARVARIAWATVATVGPDGAPRTRILHPIWEGHVGWIGTTAGSDKIRHLGREPRVSLTYWDPEQDNVHVEAIATVAADQADRDRIWQLFATTEPPLGYDPVLFWPSSTDPVFALLRLDPTRIELTGLRHRSSGRAPLVWRP
ncbi:MAG: pyridoxamine 5'-phosphate oxidase family protein [Actinophytocola sp.]|uniref:pyridoxamine 5'-phosphate oxidase family protein n=1 Tax=Actinophytocola sp. TaxID=1872138 RepID=UPI003D6C0AD8